MDNIEKYIKEIEDYIKVNPWIDEDLLIRYVYLDLARKFSFNPEYIPYGNSRKKDEIYKKGYKYSDLNKCFDENTIICNSLSKIVEIVLTHFNINIKTIVDDDLKRNKHTYNVITQKNKRPYTIDLQQDISNIQMKCFTQNYGLSPDNNKEYIISKSKQEEMNRKLGYYDFYTDEYLEYLKINADYFDDFNEKTRFVLENIEIINNPNMGYVDRQWYHVKVLSYVFNRDEFNYECDTGKIRIINCYRMVNDKRISTNCIMIQDSGLLHIYLYNAKKYKYQEIDFNHFFNALENGLIIHRLKIQEIEQEKRKRKSKSN